MAFGGICAKSENVFGATLTCRSSATGHPPARRLVALHLGCQSLANHESDMVLAGGVSVVVPHRSGYVYEEGGMESPDGVVRTFDARAAGTVFGGGVALVVLKRGVVGELVTKRMAPTSTTALAFFAASII